MSTHFLYLRIPKDGGGSEMVALNMAEIVSITRDDVLNGDAAVVTMTNGKTYRSYDGFDIVMDLVMWSVGNRGDSD